MLPKDTPILTKDGWKPIGDINIGDQVYSEDGKLTNVTGIFDNGVQPVFKMTFNDGSSCLSGEPHLWKVKTRVGRFKPDPTRSYDPELYGKWEIMSLKEIRERWGDNPNPINRVSIPVTKPVEFEYKDVEIDPYMLGILIGDGSIIKSVRLTSDDPEIVEFVKKEYEENWKGVLKQEKRKIQYSLLKPSYTGIKQALEFIGLWGKRAWDKFIPDVYKFNSVEVRLAVLRGLMDTDGACGSRGYVDYCTTSEQLAKDVQFLVQSLGGKSTIRSRYTYYTYKGEKKQGRLSFRVSARIPGINPFSLKRKADRYNEKIGWTYERILTKIEPAGNDNCVCISVDHPERTYLINDFIVTHNTTIGVIDHLLIATGWHPFLPQKLQPPTLGWILTLDWETGVGQIIWPKIKQYLPKNVKIGWLRRSNPEIPRALFFPNGSEIHFKSSESGREKMQGVKLDWAWADEEHDSEVIEEVRARLLDKGGLFSVTLTPVSRKAWVRDLELEKIDGRFTTKTVRASMTDAADAGLLDKQEVKRFLSNLPERQRRVRELGDFASLEGMVYPDFSRDIHVLTPKYSELVNSKGKSIYPWPLPPSWRRYGAIDFGFAVPTACIVGVEDPDTGTIIIVNCYYATQIRASRWGEFLRRKLPKLAMPLIADHESMERAELHAQGVPTIPADKKDKLAGIEAMERFLYPNPDMDGKPKLYFVMHKDEEAPYESMTGRVDCESLVKEIENYRYAEKKEKGPDVRDEPIKRDDHALDATRYMIYMLDKRRFGDAPSLPTWEEKPNPFGLITPPRSPWS